MDLREGTFLVRLARAAIKHYLQEHDALSYDEIDELREKELGKKQFGRQGAFVTLESHPSKSLRGCIGYPFPVKALDKAVAECAVSAAIGDPRFPPVSLEELGNTVIEVSVLSELQEIKAAKARDFAKCIEIGKDGLVIEHGPFSGLLLPQVALEQAWGPEEFLSGLCEKAGLSSDYWLAEADGKAVVKISKFQAQIFSEEKPGGKVVERR
ncbi:MAG: TIGR00296 family protein [Candidatus Micrarchaeota archaeon]